MLDKFLPDENVKVNGEIAGRRHILRTLPVGWIFGKGHLIYVWFKFTKWNNRRLYNIFWNFHISASFQVLAWNRRKHVALLNRLVGPKSFPSCNKVTTIKVKNVQTSTGTQICHNRSLLIRDQYLLIYNCEISTFLSVCHKVNENNTKGTAIVLSMFMLSFIFVIACGLFERKQICSDFFAFPLEIQLSIYGFWLPLWYLQTLLIKRGRLGFN